MFAKVVHAAGGEKAVYRTTPQPDGELVHRSIPDSLLYEKSSFGFHEEIIQRFNRDFNTHPPTAEFEKKYT